MSSCFIFCLETFSDSLISEKGVNLFFRREFQKYMRSDFWSIIFSLGVGNLSLLRDWSSCNPINRTDCSTDQIIYRSITILDRERLHRLARRILIQVTIILSIVIFLICERSGWRPAKIYQINGICARIRVRVCSSHRCLVELSCKSFFPQLMSRNISQSVRVFHLYAWNQP